MPREPSVSELVTASQIAQQIGVTVSTVMRVAERDGIPVVTRIGRASLFRRTDIPRFAVANTTGRPRGAKTPKKRT